ncbi:MAG: uroporphyrinogen-III synthase [Acidobacteriota bacterium]|nr:uroporphyrinogen-III synthase [Acidobacteriota bacterium]
MKNRQPPSVKALSLTGARVLVGRAQHQASALSSRLRKLGADVLEIPFIEIQAPRSSQPLDNAIRKLADYDWLILTSVNGVGALWDRLKHIGIRSHQLRHLKIAAIGPATKNAIEEREMLVDVVPNQYVAEAVVRELGPLIKGKRVLLARAKVARDVIPEELRKLGATVDVVEAYETVIPATSRTRLGEVMRNANLRPDVITFTSSSTVKNFLALLQTPQATSPGVRSQLTGIKLASIGPITSATLREFGLSADIEAKEYDIPGLVRAIEEALLV